MSHRTVAKANAAGHCPEGSRSVRGWRVVGAAGCSGRRPNALRPWVARASHCAVLALWTACCGAAPASGMTAVAPAFEQRLGAALPPGLRLVDADGAVVDWHALAASGRPIVLLPAYYRCATLCGTVAHGALEALADTGLPPGAWRLLLFSVDPYDTPADARVLQAVYADYARWARPQAYGAHPPELRLLTGAAADTRALARAIGFDWQAASAPAAPDTPPDYAHATGLVVLTPQGLVSRYLFGVRFDAKALRSALVEAADGRLGTPVERLLIACAHLDPLTGRHSAAVLALVRGVALAALGLLGAWVWRHRRAPRRPLP